ncbi:MULTISPECIES: sulfotransferase family 2 domain-containing protein [unclassified Candidatus Frackibacter]|uniref:sulfotransferase family 2 domain-containing protein n=1 Tax=unclassified Candidatus Frackibacter TaxID=2648818 RepID=UPI0007928B38|nr:MULTISPECIES: sulfotransferase family 2 domain-containing protein [unclassified Candidatus Frackibacter]KXS41809.1 MAG: hypothetical protein AWU54_1523 [Candidatus Frackibacter sp. T328-2]SDC55358.1 Sulfotransferase family protein [Candidatus Frackibacter sp. WG11]SEM67415.1 Sulfotransferase family protein [Candidatus Frackibacter sp. WG12]SFL78689.1 Sulfotransferase family protein [Candidatus Frackibacter sp. WG13]
MKDKILNKLLIFLHIPKTGGVTLRRIIDKQYSLDEVHEGSEQGMINRLKRDEDKLKCIQGHMKFGIHTHCSKPYTYITMLREPIERVISVYYFIRRRPQNKWYDDVKNISLKEFVSKDEFWQNNTNIQTFLLAGGERPNKITDLFNLNNLSQAKKNLNKYFSVVGITEMFDESLVLMKQELGWDDISYTRKNVSKNRLAKGEVEKEIIEIIRERNRLDIELYEYVKINLIKRIESLNVKDKDN